MGKASELFEHSQRFIQEVFAERLRQSGFVSYKGEDIHWFRIVNHEVVQAVYFVTRSATLQSTFEIRFGAHPLYISPIFQKSPYLFAEPGYEQMNDMIPETVPGSTPYGFEGLRLYGMYNRPYRVPDVLIPCPQDKNNGLDVLEKLLPVLDKLTTPFDCYQMHKKRREREIENENTFSMSTYFVDEVLFWEDEALYPFCKKYVADWVTSLERLQNNNELNRRDDREYLKRLLLLQDVFATGDRERYMNKLRTREHKNRSLLKKYTTLIL